MGINLKYFYALIGCLWGMFIGVMAAMFSISYLGRFFWIYVFGDGVWPSWVGALSALIGLFEILLGVTVGLVLGFKFGMKESVAAQTKVKTKQAVFWLALTLIVMAISSGYLIYQSKTQNIKLAGYQNDYEDLLSQVKGVDDINIDQIEDGIVIVVDIEGRSEDKYSLSLDLVGRSYVKESIYKVTEPVEFKFPQQSFHFELTFDELAKEYKKVLDEYVLNFKKELKVDEIFDVQVGLQLLETPKFDARKIEALHIPPQVFSTLLRLNFSCSESGCTVVQEKEAEAIP